MNILETLVKLNIWKVNQNSFISPINQKLVYTPSSCWFQPLWKIYSSNWIISPRTAVKIKVIFELPRTSKGKYTIRGILPVSYFSQTFIFAQQLRKFYGLLEWLVLPSSSITLVFKTNSLTPEKRNANICVDFCQRWWEKTNKYSSNGGGLNSDIYHGRIHQKKKQQLNSTNPSLPTPRHGTNTRFCLISSVRLGHVYRFLIHLSK